ncbi:rRNA maturation RNase YbeY [Aquibacillus sp. 3ASR75-11]|uniref:Endoribonuclease YbeY n=1 Tax=Terrihalobacillus insolitus TaxID=2950438 RepID=A0A9X3WVN9_9BACI|nr:rRNA maturation RNase YbeY [Terrihalobacillus insolitus]MDC3413353.1 rRNA maturation RNase YbeY [Terrihalobacillus insolitus]MDC3424936.1 rRNA maturation RNase YbeY [Terrihalobacillus insolitus]
MHIDFHDETNSVDESKVDLIQRLLTYAGKHEHVSPEAELSVNFVDNREIQIINRNYRQKDSVTDVISFAMEEEGDGEMEIKGANLPVLLGDIVISIDKAEEQATEYGHSLERELGFLALHGFLHLLGYDHMKVEDEKKMFAKQEEILYAFGLERN